MNPLETKRKKLFPGLFFSALFGAVALAAAWKIAANLIDAHRSQDFWEDLQDCVVIMETAPPGEAQPDETQPAAAPDRRNQFMAAPESGTLLAGPSIPAAIDFDALYETSRDVVAWIYAPDTEINYPVAQARDNSYYLRRLLNGKGAVCGTIFADYRCSADLSDWNTIIYGHQMDNGTMFGSLAGYRDQAYYEAHPVMYLYVPGQRYRLELIAGYVTNVNDPLYYLPSSREERDAVLAQALEKSTFRSGVTVGEDDRLVTLSTCAYDFNNARYVVIGRLTAS